MAGRVIWSSVYLFTAFWCGWAAYILVADAIHLWPKFTTDFTVFYTAVRSPFEIIYNVEALTRAQAWAGEDGSRLRPFPYPPSFLFFVWPFGRLAFLPALLSWIALGFTLFAAATWRLIGRPWPLLLLSPAVAMGAITGQVTFMIGAALMAGVLLLKDRPIMAGVVFGLAATIKPQAVLLVPFALVFAGQWRALGSAVVMGALVGLASLAVHQGLWLQWLGSLSEFNDIIAKEEWARTMSATPTGLLRRQHMDDPLLVGVVQTLSAVFALVITFRAFRQPDPVRRYGALAIGYLLISPYALWYELALLQPVAIVALLDKRWTHRVAGLLGFTFLPRGLGVLALGVVSAFDDKGDSLGDARRLESTSDARLGSTPRP